MKFYKKLIRSFNDLPNLSALLIHSLAKCNFKCFQCHNYKELIERSHNDYYTEKDIINHLKLNGYLFDAIIFSGGEFLLEDIDDIGKLFKKIRSIYNGILIINSNGSFPNKIDFLLGEGLADGIHLDMKLPYHRLDIEKDKEIYKDIIGIYPNKQLVNNLLKSVDIVVKNNSKYSQIRTVKYPILSDDFFKETKIYIDALNKKYNSDIKYYINEFHKI